MPANEGLDQKQIDRIVSEERLREQIRSELTPPDSKPKRGIISFLNSPFGLFLLSSVVLAGFGRIYSDMQVRNEELKSTRAALIELLSELDLRATQAQYFAEQVDDGPETKRSYYCILLWRVVIGDPFYRPTSPAFKNVHWMGLLSKARVLTPLEDAGAAAAVTRLELGVNGGRCDRGSRFSKDVRVLVQQSVLLNDWLRTRY